ncbi:outer membrane protein OmpK [Azotobacter armeniacus]
MKKTFVFSMLAGALIFSSTAISEESLLEARYNPPPPEVQEETQRKEGGSPLLWQDNSVSYLWGKDYEVTTHHQQNLTFEHFSLWNWGDLWAFWDNYWFNGGSTANGNHQYYGEITPRFSLGKLTGKDMSFGPVKDVLLAVSYQYGSGDVEALRFGPGFDFDIPGFNFVQLNVLYIKPEGSRHASGSWMLNPVWSITFPVGRSDILFDGFMDWTINNRSDSSDPSRNYHSNLHFNPQIKYDLGKLMNFGEKRLYVGIEYNYWSNKYGIKDTSHFDTNQNATSLLVKYHF